MPQQRRCNDAVIERRVMEERTGCGKRDDFWASREREQARKMCVCGGGRMAAGWDTFGGMTESRTDASPTDRQTSI